MGGEGGHMPSPPSHPCNSEHLAVIGLIQFGNLEIQTIKETSNIPPVVFRIES